MPVSNKKAPFNQSPEFTRDSFLRPPDWRWQEAKKLVHSQVTSTPCVQSEDPLVIYVARIQKACLVPQTREYIRVKMPDIWQVFSLGNMDNSSQLRASLQACIISGLSHKQISQKLKWISEVQVKLYSDLFCDLTGVQGISEWFEQMLLQPARQHKSMNLFRARALAHYHSLEAALHSLRFGNAGKSAKTAMQAMWREARNTQLFDYMAKNLNVPIQVYVQSMEIALKNRQEHAFILQNKEGAQSNESIAAITAGLDNSIRSFTQAEISQNSNEGQDPASTYIKTITSKQKA